MGAGFEFQFRIRAAAVDAGDDFLEAAVFASAGRFHFDFPALALGVARVHAEQVAGEDRGFVAAGAGAHFQIHAAVVAGVLRHQLRHQLGVEFRQPGLSGVDLFFGQFRQLRVAAHRLGGGQIGARLAFGGQAGGDRFELRALAHQPAIARGVVHRRRIGEQAFDFLAALGQRFQLTAQGRRHCGGRCGVGCAL